MVGDDAGEETQPVGQVGCTGSARLCLLLRLRWETPGGGWRSGSSDLHEGHFGSWVRIDLGDGHGSGASGGRRHI